MAVAVFALLGGCATPEGPKFSEAAPPPANEALVYVYRGNAAPYAFSSSISVDAVKVVELPNKGYTQVYVKPGEYTIKSQWPLISAAPSRESKLAFAAGETYFVRLGGEMHVSGPFRNQTIISSTSLFTVPASIGKQEMAELVFVKPEVERIR